MSFILFCFVLFFFFNDTATTEIYTLSLHDALPILSFPASSFIPRRQPPSAGASPLPSFNQTPSGRRRSEEHTSELQSRQYLVCRLLLEKKKIPTIITTSRLDLLQQNTDYISIPSPS